MWYTYTLEYYSVMKNNETLPFPTTWMNLEGMMLMLSYVITYMWKLTNKQMNIQNKNNKSSWKNKLKKIFSYILIFCTLVIFQRLSFQIHLIKILLLHSIYLLIYDLFPKRIKMISNSTYAINT